MRKMKTMKIEWDLVNGVSHVLEFRSDTEIIEGLEVEDLRERFDGTRGAEVSVELFNNINDEYGIN